MLDKELIKTFREAAIELPKEKRRKFQARITKQYLVVSENSPNSSIQI